MLAQQIKTRRRARVKCLVHYSGSENKGISYLLTPAEALNLCESLREHASQAEQEWREAQQAKTQGCTTLTGVHQPARDVTGQAFCAICGAKLP